MMQSSSHLRLTIALRLAAAVFFLQGSINASLPSLAFVRINNNNNVKTIICAGNGVRIDMTIFLSRQTRISFPNNNNPFLLNMAKNEKDYTSPMRQRKRSRCTSSFHFLLYLLCFISLRSENTFYYSSLRSLIIPTTHVPTFSNSK